MNGARAPVNHLNSWIGNQLFFNLTPRRSGALSGAALDRAEIYHATTVRYLRRFMAQLLFRARNPQSVKRGGIWRDRKAKRVAKRHRVTA